MNTELTLSDMMHVLEGSGLRSFHGSMYCDYHTGNAIESSIRIAYEMGLRRGLESNENKCQMQEVPSQESTN